MKIRHLLLCLLFVLLGLIYSRKGQAQSPGGITTELSLWFKANAGVYSDEAGATPATSGTNNVRWWYNLAPNLAIPRLGHINTSFRPNYSEVESNLINFNPTVVYDGNNDRTEANNVATTHWRDAGQHQIYVVMKSASTGSGTVAFAHGRTGTENFRYTQVRLSGSGIGGEGCSGCFEGVASGAARNTAVLLNSAFDYGLVNGYRMRRNGIITESKSPTNPLVYSPEALGGNSDDWLSIGRASYESFASLNGSVAEVVSYRKSQQFGAANVYQRIESYLGVKYGITLGSPTSVYSYLKSNGTAIWTGNATYQRNIAGIGRDDASLLYQKQSKSENAGNQVVLTMAGFTTTNALNTSSIGDGDFYIIGDNGGSEQFHVGTSFPNTSRMGRVWKRQVTGSSIANVQVAFPKSAFKGFLGSPALIHGNDAALGVTSTLVASSGTTTLNGVEYYYFSLPASSEFFSFTGADFISPGGVNNNLSLWFKADAGVYSDANGITPSVTGANNVAYWQNQAANPNISSVAHNAFKPNYSSTATVNFHPSITFNGTDDRLQANNVASAYWRNADQHSVYTVSLPTKVTNGDLFNHKDNAGMTGRVLLTTLGAARGGNSSMLSTMAANKVTLRSLTYKAGSSGFLHRLADNGAVLPVSQNINENTTIDGAGSDWLFIGYGNNSFGGRIVEVIGYRNNQKETGGAEDGRIESYLALKYGITLNSGVSRPYVASDGTTVVYNGSGAYSFNIAGIGRDDLSALYQKQSVSQNGGFQPVIGLGTLQNLNTANTGTLTDKQYLVWGSNNSDEAFDQFINVGGVDHNHMSRVWKVTNTGGVGAVTVAVPSSYLSAGSNPKLIVSNDPAIDASDTYIPLSDNTTINGVVHRTVSVTLTTGQYFSFAVQTPSPGGVKTGLMMWLKANDGPTTSGAPTANGGLVDAWADKSGSGNNVTSPGVYRPHFNGTNSPISSYFNFNDRLNFDGSDQEMNRPALVGGSPSSLSAFTIAQRAPISSTATSYRFLWNLGTSNNNNPSLVLENITNTATNVRPQLWRSTNIKVAESGAVDQRYNIRANLYGAYFTTDGGLSKNNLMINGNAPVIGTNTATALGAEFRIGAPRNVGFPVSRFHGSISEHIMYDVDLSNTAVYTNNELSRVNSYLAIKYGVTLKNGANADPVDYLNSQSVTIWSGVANSTYHNNVAGIMRDDNSGLMQRQSISNRGFGSLDGQHPYGQVAIGLGTIAGGSNKLNTNDFSTDLQSLVWGDNNITSNLNGGNTTFTWNGVTTNIRSLRVWRVQNKDVTDSLLLNMPADAWGSIVPAAGTCDELVVVVASDAAFTNVIATYPVKDAGTAFGGASAAKETKLVFPNGASYFAVGRASGNPGAVVLPTAATTAAAEFCPKTTGLKYYYRNTSGKQDKIFAIDWSNSTEPSGVTGTVTYSGTHYANTQGDEKVVIMGRLLTVTPAGGDFSASPVKVRFYYSDIELTGSEGTHTNELVNTIWFKYPGDAAATIAANNGSQIPGSVTLIPDVYGVEDGVSYVEFHNITGFSTFGYASKSALDPSISIPLPVTLKSFSGSKVSDTKAKLVWRTADEVNLKGYEVEASKDGLSFSKIATVGAKGAVSETTYEATVDYTAPLTYYRLKMVDKDGKYKYSHVVRISSALTGSSVVIYPNPVTAGVYTVKLSGYTQGAVVRVVDQAGKVISQRRVSEGSTQLQAKGLAQGVYLVQIEDAATHAVSTQKLVIASK